MYYRLPPRCDKSFHPYNRDAAVEYARKWALGRNPAFKDYSTMGGDCTNFVSQCLLAARIPFITRGNSDADKWYWFDDEVRVPSWTGVVPFRSFLLTNNTNHTCDLGAFAALCAYGEVEPGDIIQRAVNGRLVHTMIATQILKDTQGQTVDILICGHSFDALDRSLATVPGDMSYIKIYGYYA